MNYIRHLHAFYHHVKRDDRLSPFHVSLYLAIFQYWNYNRFQNPFRIDRDELMRLSKIGSKNTYHKCMKELHKYQYVFYHSGITKYQNVKISVIRLDYKAEEKGLKQLDLFSPDEIGHSMPDSSPSPGLDYTHEEDAPGDAAGTGTDTHISTGNDTHQCTGTDTLMCTGNDTCLCPKTGTACVPNPVLNIKHKHSLKQTVCKTEENTHTQIFEKNKIIGNAIAEMAGLKPGGQAKREGLPATKNCLRQPATPGETGAPIIRVSLPMVENYFQENNFSTTEAKKFFLYNQGRGWMLTDTLPVFDWQALAQKWMLNNLTPKFAHHVRSAHQQKPDSNPGPGKDYSEPL